MCFVKGERSCLITIIILSLLAARILCSQPKILDRECRCYFEIDIQLCRNRGQSYRAIFHRVRFARAITVYTAAAAEGLRAHQMDVTTAFLYANLDEGVYMELVDGMKGAREGNKVASLWKAI